MSYGPYPQYKDSEVEWLGEVPEHWSVFALKRTVDGCVNGIWGSEPDGENDIPVIRVADFQRNQLQVNLEKLTYRSILQKERGGRSLEFGDLLIEKSGGGDKTLVGCVVRFTHEFPAVTSNFVARMRPLNGFDGGFLLYAFDSLYQGRVNYPSIKQTTGIQNLDSEAYLQERFCFPTVFEQTQIARFLDHETGKIDGLIAEQEKLIELLKEKRQALALQAYLDRDSTILRLGNAVDVIARPVQYESEREYVALGIYNRGRGLFHKESKPQEELGDSDFFVIEEGDLILSGQFAWEGSVALAGPSETGTIVSHRYPVIRGKSHICLTEYVFALLTTREGDFLLNECSRGAAGRNRPLNIGALLKEKIKIPSMALQHKIVSFVHEEKKLLSEIKATIKLLEERRSALISSVVTGKIDVRNWEPQGEAE